MVDLLEPSLTCSQDLWSSARVIAGFVVTAQTLSMTPVRNLSGIQHSSSSLTFSVLFVAILDVANTKTQL